MQAAPPPTRFAAAPKKRQRRFSYFGAIAIAGLAAVFIGFAKTFFLPLSNGKLNIPASIHIHGAFAFAWIIFFFWQSMAVYRNRIRWHMQAGWAGLFIAVGVAVTMIPAGMFEVSRSLKTGGGDFAYSTIFGVCTSALMFLSFVLAGIVYRKKGAIHKRLLLLATIIVLWPAWFRFRHYFPSVPNPEVWFGVVLSDSLILVAWLCEYFTRKKLHPVLLFGGLFIIIENSIEVYCFGNETWQSISKTIYLGLSKIF